MDMFPLLLYADGQALAESVMVIGNVSELGVKVVMLLLVALLIVALWRIYDAANAAAPAHRTMNPTMVWLLLIPVFNAFWNFKALPAVSNSLAATLRDKGLVPGDCGQNVGMVWAVLVVILTLLQLVTHVAVFVCGDSSAGFGIDNLLADFTQMGAVGEILKLVFGALGLGIIVCAVMYIVKVQAAKSQLMAAGNAPTTPA
jgi:hypothetical protein